MLTCCVSAIVLIMGIQDRRARERAAQRQLITTAARVLAEREGWEAVTTRRLSTEIEYSQPVIYRHFTSMEDLIEAIALQGFAELAETLGAARRRATQGDAVAAVARAYSAYGLDNPALYDAMFTRDTKLPFGTDRVPAPLSSAYGQMRAAVATNGDEQDVDTLTEVLWASLHGLTALDRNGRLRPEQRLERIDLLVDHFRTTRR